MKRDMDIVRRITLETQSMDSGHVLTGIDDVDQAMFGEHVILMVEAGLIEAQITKFQSGEPPKARVQRLTWAGQDFADSIASDTVWNTVKAKVIKPGVSWTFGILTELLKEEAKSGFPTLRQ